MGTSVPPTHSSKAMIGDTVSRMAQRTQSLAPATRSETANTVRNTIPNHTRGIGQRSVTEQGLRQAEQRHQRQVGVIQVGVGGGGQHLRALIRRAVVDQRLGRAGHHAHLGLTVPGPHHPDQRDEDGPADQDAECDVHSDGRTRPPGHDGECGQAVGAGGAGAPQPVQRIRAEQGNSAGEQGAADQPGGQPEPGHRHHRLPSRGRGSRLVRPRPPSRA